MLMYILWSLLFFVPLWTVSWIIMGRMKMSTQQKLLATGTALFLILAYPPIMFHWGKTGVFVACLAVAGFMGAYLAKGELAGQSLSSSEKTGCENMEDMEHERWLLAGLEEHGLSEEMVVEAPEFQDGISLAEVAQEEEGDVFWEESQQEEAGARSIIEVESSKADEALVQPVVAAASEEELLNEMEEGHREDAFEGEKEKDYRPRPEEDRLREEEVDEEELITEENRIEPCEELSLKDAVDYSEMETESGGEDSCIPVAIVDREEAGAEDAEGDLNTLIEEGFKAKNEGKWDKAREFFAKALSLKVTDQLSYLLNLEISHLSGSLGDYEGAIEALARAEACAPKMQKGEVMRQARYLKAVAELLDSMALPRVPLYEVPRMVRIKAEQMAEEKTGGWRE